MKATHIILIVIIAVAIGVIISTTGDASKYVSFKEAYQMAKDGGHIQLNAALQAVIDQ